MYCKNCGSIMHEQQSVCLNCGVLTGAGNTFCPNCGNRAIPGASFCTVCGASLTASSNKSNPNVQGLTNRSLPLYIILSIVTCGIFAIYWFICLTNDMNKASGKQNDMNGAISLVLTLVTCGIFSFVWAYKLGQKRDIVANEKESSGILYLVLTFFGLGIVVYALAQDTLNKAIDAK